MIAERKQNKPLIFNTIETMATTTTKTQKKLIEKISTNLLKLNNLMKQKPKRIRKSTTASKRKI